MPFHILWGGNVYEIIRQYFKYHLVRLQALVKAVKGLSVVSMSWGD